MRKKPWKEAFLGVAERDYPQAIVMASSLNSIFANFGIALGSATGGLIVDHLSMRVTGFGGAVYILAALLLVMMQKLQLRILQIGKMALMSTIAIKKILT